MAKHGNYCYETLIDGDGEFKINAIENCVKKDELHNCGTSYSVVSIIGKQSSGKSMLLNCLFGTKFKEMNAERGRSKTTQGICIARSEEGKGALTLVLDVEGIDGRERGEYDTAFEKQSSLFVLAISNVVLINIWCHDINLHNAAHRPLLKTIFQERKKLVSARKITLFFVIRDLTETPLDILKNHLLEDIASIWECVDVTPLKKNFNVEVVGLHHYKYEKGEFDKEVAMLRERLFSLCGDGLVPLSGFSRSSEDIWKLIKLDKMLNLPSHKVMVSTVLCEQIADEICQTFAAKEEWCQLKQSVENNGTVPGFVNKLNSLMKEFLSEYDKESTGFDEGARSKSRNRLEEDLYSKVLKPTFKSALEYIRSRALDKFKDSFGKVLKEKKAVSEPYQDNIISSCLHYFDQECPDVEFEEANKDKIQERKNLVGDIDGYIVNEVEKQRLEDKISGMKEFTSIACVFLSSLAAALLRTRGSHGGSSSS